MKLFGKTLAEVNAEKTSRDLASCLVNRRNAYRDESDPLFFDYQRGEKTKEEWMAKIAEIKSRYPKPSATK